MQEAEESTAGWTLTVPPELAGLRVDRFVASRVERLSRTRAARCPILDLDRGVFLKKSQTVTAGMRLFVERPCPDEAPTVEPQILVERDGLLVLDKPAGLAVHPTARYFKSTVTHWLEIKGLSNYEPVHRLDVETSGVLLCAEKGVAEKAAKTAFFERTTHKTYLAVVQGLPDWDEVVNETPLAIGNGEVRIKMAAAEPDPTHNAKTSFRVLKRGCSRALVEARPETGRQHQIRVHLSQLGFWIVGDKLYGPDDSLFLASLDRPLTPEEFAILGHTRQALHAASLSLPWGNQGRLQFESPLPNELLKLLDS